MRSVVFFFAIISFGAAGYAFAQQSSSDQTGAEGDAFTFVRIQYDNAGGGLDDDWGWGQWGTGGVAAGR